VAEDPKEMAIKNLVITESAYHIDMKIPGEPEEPNTIACPRCGHVQEQKPRTVCVSCKRLIPRQKARQGWEQKKRILYADMEQYFEKDTEEEAGVKFDKSRKGPSLLDHIRSVAILAGLGATLYFGVPACLKAALGEPAFNKMDRNIHQYIAHMFKPAPPAVKKKHR
jgi:hypothetical protein